MQNQITIRNAVRQDAPKIVQFNQAMALETEGHQLNEQILTKGVNAIFDEPRRGFYLVAEIDGQVAGSLMVTTEWSDWRNADFWWVQSVYVDPKYRRRGLFRTLYQEVKQRAQNTAGVCGCRLYVERENSTAQETYTQLGFTETCYKFFEDSFK